MKGDSEAGAPWKRQDWWVGQSCTRSSFPLLVSGEEGEDLLQLTFSQGTMHISSLFLLCCPEK